MMYGKQWQPTQLPADQEQTFQQQWTMDPDIRAWRNSFAQTYGEQPNPNDAGYDYRGAVMNGVRPVPYEYDGGQRHWGSTAETPSGGLLELKAPDHGTRWMQGFMEKFGVDPHEAQVNGMTPEQQQFQNDAMMQQYYRGLLSGYDGGGE